MTSLSTKKDKGMLHTIQSHSDSDTVKKAIKLLLQVVANIVKYPFDEKYRKLKSEKISPKINNSEIQKYFFDILFNIGFVDLNTHIELPMTAKLEPLAELVGEIESKPAPSVPNMNSDKSDNNGCCQSGSSDTNDCCSSDKKNNEKTKSGGCCGGNSGTDGKKKNTEPKKSGCCSNNNNTHSHSQSHSHSDSDSHSHSHDGHSHDDHSHSHGGDGHSHGGDGHSHGKSDKKGGCCSSETQAQTILNKNMAEIEKQKAEKKAEKEKIKQKMANSRKEKNAEVTTSSIAKNTKFGATIAKLPKDEKCCGSSGKGEHSDHGENGNNGKGSK